MKAERTINQPRKSWYLDLIDRPARPRWDVSPLWADEEAFAALVDDIKTHFEGVQYDLIVAQDALGFILGGAIAASAGKGLVPPRKGGKIPLPGEWLISVDFQDFDEMEKTFEFVKGLIKPGKLDHDDVGRYCIDTKSSTLDNAV